MIDDRMLELLNAEIDDELSSADRSELSRRLLNEPESRAVREDLRRACAGLDALTVAEPPAGLRERILAALPQAVPATNGAGQASLRFLSSASALRYAAAIVGALLVGTIAFEASRSANGVDPDQAVGTMASPPAATQAGLGVLRVDSSRVRGTITLAPTAQDLDVRFDFDASQPEGAVAPEAIDVFVTRGHAVAHLTGSAAAQQAGAAAMAAALPGAVEAGEPVEVRVIASGVTVFEGRWQAPVAR